jgi:hypothetical protein
MLIVAVRPAMSALPELFSAALKAIGSPNGTGLGAPLRNASFEGRLR